MVIAVLLIVLGVVLTIRNAFLKGKNLKELQPEKPSEGETLKNSYIIRHEQKLKDDAEYEEYLEWCRFKGELPQEKEGFDSHRMEEYHLYKKLLKHGIGGL